MSKTLFVNALMENQYLVSPAQSIQHYEWRFMPVPLPFPISISSTTMPSSRKITSTSKLSTTLMAKAKGTNKAVTDASNRETSNETTKQKKKKKQIMEISEEEKGEEKSTNNDMEDDSKFTKLKK